MMRVAVCDDQSETLREIQELLLQEEDIKKVDIYSDIEMFFCMVNEEKEYDVVWTLTGKQRRMGLILQGNYIKVVRIQN